MQKRDWPSEARASELKKELGQTKVKGKRSSSARKIRPAVTA